MRSVYTIVADILMSCSASKLFIKVPRGTLVHVHNQNITSVLHVVITIIVVITIVIKHGVRGASLIIFNFHSECVSLPDCRILNYDTHHISSVYYYILTYTTSGVISQYNYVTLN